MSRIFLSHSSKDDFAAIAIRDWLRENGWDEVFLDLDPSEGIHPGQRWERELHEQASRCEAVVFVVSRNWIASEWCRREYDLARRLNKRIFVVIIDDLAIAELPHYLTETHQAVSLGQGHDHEVRRVERPGTHQEGFVHFSAEGLARLKAGLAAAGLDARFFSWPPANDPDRYPYRGLEPLEAADAGIFFGREAPVIDALDALRGIREGSCPRLFVILGASGAGKSSFLRAGLLPRLVRDDRNFLPLAPLRPERAAITGAAGLVAALSAACADKGMTVTRAELRDAASQGADALRPCLRELVARARAASSAPKDPTIVLPVDQAEELFRAEGAQEAEALLALLRELATKDDPAISVLFVIRSDSYDALEHAKALEGLSQHAFPLLPMPRGVYQTVIEGPARRFARGGRTFEIDPALTQLLLSDLDKGAGSDALPLLAFTLGQLFSDHMAAGRLARADYEKFGGLKGAIDAAVARAFLEADKDGRIPRDHDARLALLRRGLVPWLAGIDPETKTPRRRRAPDAQIPAEARALIDLLVEQRLLTRAVDEETGETTLEPAHEALLRQWGSLKGWLEEDFARLVTLEGVKRAARDWDANARDAAWASHSGARLDEADRLDARPDLAALLDPADRAYLAACREKQSEAHAKEQALAVAEARAAQRTRIGLAASLVLAVLAAGAAIYGFNQAKVAGEQKAVAEQQKIVADQQRGEADRQRAEADWQKVEAQRQTESAKQRSAVLAAGVAQNFVAEGALDEALLLLLDAAQAFDDTSSPDKIRIALTKTLQKRERVETRTLFPNMQVFDTDDALLLVDPSTRDIWSLTNSIAPRRLVAGEPNDSKIVGLSASGKDFVLLRENGDVERINSETGVRRKAGRFPEPPARPGVSYKQDESGVTDEGLAFRSFYSFLKGESSDPHLQIFDSENGRLLQTDIKFPNLTVRRRPAGGVYVYSGYDGTEPAVEIVESGNRTVRRETKLTAQQNLALRLGSCSASLPGTVRAAIEKYLNDGPGFNGTVKCRRFGDSYLITTISYGSGGAWHSDMLFPGKESAFDVREKLEKSTGPLSVQNVAWIGVSTAGTNNDKTRLAVLANRSAYVLDEYNRLILDYRHSSRVEFARFIASDRLAVVDAENGRIIVHAFGDTPQQRLLATSLDGLVGQSSPVRTLNFGTCVGRTVDRIDEASLPDGRTIVITDKNEIRLSGAGERLIPLDASSDQCVQFSRDWKRMLITGKTEVVIYDLDKVLAAGALSGHETGRLPIRAYTAMFAGARSDQIVVADGSNRVNLWTEDAAAGKWSAREIYRGDLEVIYAEPDGDGQRFIIMEAVGSSISGLVYSAAAREVWYQLGSDYKWLGAAFLNPTELVVRQNFSLSQAFALLPLSRLAEIADGQLSAECRPPDPKAYQKSPCWPASVQ